MVWVVLCEACAAPESLEMHRKSPVFPEAVVKQLWGDETKWLQGSGGDEASNARGVGTQITAQSQMCYRTKSAQRLWGGKSNRELKHLELRALGPPAPPTAPPKPWKCIELKVFTIFLRSPAIPVPPPKPWICIEFFAMTSSLLFQNC